MADSRPQWRWASFPELSGSDVYDILTLRSRVFVVEQDCIFLDADGRDRDAWHLLGWSGEAADRRLIAYARVFEAGVRYAEVSIGRIVTAPEARGTGVGRMIVEESMRFCAERWPAQPIRIGAQRRLERFYAGIGFVSDGAPYLEDDIEHIDMLLTENL
ncbi:MAG: GNAT family N-acetyltransferase [Gemmatimonadota bacterium]|nr:GNAT family N-acetyltransferase [Gemmatimonadota bacterium]